MKLYAVQLPEGVAKDSEVFISLAGHLTPEARERLDRIRLPQDALRSLVGKLAPTWYLYTSGTIPPTTKPTYTPGKTGKPYLQSPDLDTPFTFNISHDGEYVLLGVSTSPKAKVGVDMMEYPSNPQELQEGISFQLTRDEKLHLAGVIGSEYRAEALSTLWSMKEAYVKATGDGIQFGLERINVGMDSEGTVVSVSVDGEDVRSLKWDFSTGTLTSLEPGGKKHRWAAYWTNDEWEEIHQIEWTQFTKPFL